jgi:carboxyl-terminal processing protease
MGNSKVEEYAGVGIVIDYEKPSNHVQIVQVIYRSPADRAKIKRGLRLIAVDGQRVQGMALVDVGNKIRGPVGTEVRLTLANPFNGTSREFTLKRKKLKTRADVWVPPPGHNGEIPSGSGHSNDTNSNNNQSSSELTAKEMQEIKKVIAGLKTDEQRKKMRKLLEIFKNKEINKYRFFKVLYREF